MTVPVKGCSSVRSGITGRVNIPIADTTMSKVYSSPAAVVRLHVLVAESQLADTISVFSFRFGSSRYRRAHRSKYSRISCCPDHSRDQRGLRSKEYEYRWDFTSQARPG